MNFHGSPRRPFHPFNISSLPPQIIVPIEFNLLRAGLPELHHLIIAPSSSSAGSKSSSSAGVLCIHLAACLPAVHYTFQSSPSAKRRTLQGPEIKIKWPNERKFYRVGEVKEALIRRITNLMASFLSLLPLLLLF